MVDLVASFDLWVGRSNACCRICSQQKQPKRLQHIIYLRDVMFMSCTSATSYQSFGTFIGGAFAGSRVLWGACGKGQQWLLSMELLEEIATTKPRIHRSCRHWFSGVFHAFVMGWYHVNVGDGGRTAASKCYHLQCCDLGLWLHSKSPSLMFWNSWWAVNSVTSGVKSMDVNVCTSHPICNQQ